MVGNPSFGPRAAAHLVLVERVAQLLRMIKTEAACPGR
jgi:hypothetical protein